jgi:hypothetical protein
MSDGDTLLPPGWIAGTLGDFIRPRGEKADPQEFPELTFLGMDHVEAHTMRIVGGVSGSSMKSAAARFYRGDVLYGRLRPYLNKVARPWFDGLASAEFMVFPEKKWLCSEFLKLRLNSVDFVGFASHLNEGDRPRVDFSQISTFPLLVPPANEQRRIVAKIEELFSEIDKGIESLTTAREQLKAYRQSILKAAFEGKLTEGWRSKKPDARWKTGKFGDFFKVQSGYAFKSMDYCHAGVPLIRIGDIQEDRVRPSNKTAYLSEYHMAENKAFLIHKNDLLIAMSGATTGKFGCYDSDEPALLNQRVGRVLVKPGTSILLSNHPPSPTVF